MRDRCHRIDGEWRCWNPAQPGQKHCWIVSHKQERPSREPSKMLGG